MEPYDDLASDGMRAQLFSAESELADGSTIVCSANGVAELIAELLPFLIKLN